jgi:hypothetical protein
MKFKVAKYQFDSKEQYQAKIASLHSEDDEGNKVPNFKFAKVELGHIVLEDATYDEDGEVETEAVMSEGWHVDMAWWLEGITTVKEEAVLDEDGMVVTPEVTSIDHPYGWKTYKVDFEEGQGMHSFAGVDYQSNKI